MSRVIKFRSWDSVRNEYLSAGNVFIPIHPSKNPKTCNKLNLDTSNFLCADGRMVLEQFTGLTDINGVDIYEGDLLHELDPCQWKPAQVVFKDGAFEISLTKRTRYPINAKYIRENELVIIGNIHQNPDLIK